jgi:hypothetical protein
MRRLPILLAFGLVFALLVVAAATAAPPNFCDEEKFGLNHANCDEPPTEPPMIGPCKTTTRLPVGSSHLDCEWSPANTGATFGTVKVEAIGDGEISKVAVWVLDDFPGDICVFDQWNNAKTRDKVFEVQFPLVNADGDTYWEFDDDDDPATEPIVGAHWCSQFDDARVDRLDDLNGEPLHVRVNLRVGKGTVVDVTLATLTPAEG